MTETRPTWCPDAACEHRGVINDMFCGGRYPTGARFCTRFRNTNVVLPISKITDSELTDIQRLTARLYAEAK